MSGIPNSNSPEDPPAKTTRSTIHTIDYDVQEVVNEENSAVLAMTATVVRLDGTIDQFEAMLLLKFNEAGLVTLWYEVYLKTQ